METSGSLTVGLDVIRPDGTTVYTLNNAIDTTCLLDAAGTHTILVRDAAGIQTGDYRLVLERFPGPTGCTAVKVGGAIASDAMDVPGDMDCFTFKGKVGQKVHFAVVLTGGSMNPYAEVLRPDGSTICGPTTADGFDCTLDVQGSHTLIVRDATGPNRGTYTVKLTKA